MAVINVHDAKTNFSKLLGRVESGEEVVIAKAGKPVAKIVPLEKKIVKRKPGSAKGRIKIKPEFFVPLPDEILKQFEK
jgi:prevent-host-death family protein